MPKPAFNVRFQKHDGTWQPIDPVDLLPVSDTRYICADWAAPQGSVSAGILFDRLPDGAIRVLEKWPLPPSRSELQRLARRARTFRPRKHACSDMGAYLRHCFPRLTTAQIERLARVIRRRQGRPSCARITGLTFVTTLTTSTTPLTRDDWDQLRDRLRGAR